jgi:hypothetical protein
VNIDGSILAPHASLHSYHSNVVVRGELVVPSLSLMATNSKVEVASIATDFMVLSVSFKSVVTFLSGVVGQVCGCVHASTVRMPRLKRCATIQTMDTVTTKALVQVADYTAGRAPGDPPFQLRIPNTGTGI